MYAIKAVILIMVIPQKALTPPDEKFEWEALSKSPKIDYPADMIDDQKEKK